MFPFYRQEQHFRRDDGRFPHRAGDAQLERRAAARGAATDASAAANSQRTTNSRADELQRAVCPIHSSRRSTAAGAASGSRSNFRLPDLTSKTCVVGADDGISIAITGNQNRYAANAATAAATTTHDAIDTNVGWTDVIVSAHDGASGWNRTNSLGTTVDAG